jgi:hypothetical protein
MCQRGFNFLLLVQASLLCLLSHRRDSAEYFWRVLAVIFLALSVDELFSFHERLIGPLRILIGPPAFFTLRGSFREHCWC